MSQVALALVEIGPLLDGERGFGCLASIAIVEAQGGRVAGTTPDGVGATFEVRPPARPSGASVGGQPL